MNKLNFQPIAMKCTYEEYLSIKDFIVENIDKEPDGRTSKLFPYLTNQLNGIENYIGFLSEMNLSTSFIKRGVYNQFCAKTFLNACGFDVEQNAQLEWKVKWQLKDHAENEYLKNINVLKTLRQENDALRQEIKELKDHYNKKEIPSIGFCLFSVKQTNQ